MQKYDFDFGGGDIGDFVCVRSLIDFLIDWNVTLTECQLLLVVSERIISRQHEAIDYSVNLAFVLYSYFNNFGNF